MRAVVQNRPLAEASGVSTPPVDRTTFFIGSGLAGIAGVAIALLGSIGPTLGTAYIVNAFLVVIVGGLGSLRGAVIAAFAIGIFNSYTEYLTTDEHRVGRGLRGDHHLPAIPTAGHRRATHQVTGMSNIQADDLGQDARPRRRLRARSDRPRSSARWCCSFIAPAMLTEFRLDLLAKFACFAIIAVGIDLAWGYGGMLVLGQGVFFGLGGYAMAMYMKLQDAGPGDLPDFMTWSGIEKLPAVWKPFQHAWFAIPATVLVPMLVAVLLGSLVFRRRVRGRLLRDPQPGAGRGVRDPARSASRASPAARTA